MAERARVANPQEAQKMVSVGRVPAFRSPKLKIKNMKHLEELAKEYAQKNFPICEGSNSNIIKHYYRKRC